MTHDGRFKKQVRARMEADDVAYMEARRRVLAEQEAVAEQGAEAHDEKAEA